MTAHTYLAPGTGLERKKYDQSVRRELNRALAYPSIRTVTASDTITDADTVVLADATAEAVTLTLPAAGDVIGKQVVVKKIDASANAVTIDGSGSETIDGAATKATSTQWASYTLASDGTGWFIL